MTMRPNKQVYQLLWKAEDDSYYISSACRLPALLTNEEDMYETMVFRSSPTGKIDKYEDLSCVHFIGHNEAIKAAGFDIVGDTP
jgi:hypothetical protein